MNALSKAKDFKKSRTGLYVSMATSAFGAFGVYKQIKAARSDNDTLRLLDAVLTGAAVVTNLAILYRDLKRQGDDDILLG
ncbi:hypothetical protein ACWD4G_12815 [Streptomyces sp. NPDC002643]